MKKQYFASLLLFSLLFFVACSDSDSKDTGDDFQETEKSVTAENLQGEWELYYFTKSLNDNLALRYVEEDGFANHFTSETDFVETNAVGMNTMRGTYKVLADSKVETDYTNAAGENKESTFRVAYLSDKRLTKINTYSKTENGVLLKVTDTRVYRNKSTMPTEYPGVTKEVVTRASLDGTWELTSFTQKLDGVKTPESDEKEANLYKGNLMLFTTDGKFTYTNNKGTFGGTYILVDDVIHLIVDELSDKNSLRARRSFESLFTKSAMTKADTDPESFTLWLKDWLKDSATGSVTGFHDYSKTMGVPEGQTKVALLETSTKWARKAQ